ncbi:outer membrane lipoprotein-sorting protein [Candidatus Margulisiibacteriota bacterium]
MIKKLKNQREKVKTKAYFAYIICLLLLICGFNFLLFNFAFAMTGQQILDKIDDNMTYDSAKMESRMVIHVRDDIRTKKMISYSKGRDKSYSEFTYPARDEGVKYLKIDDNMWIYMPSVEKIIKIAGHMLRQSMMGSDFSYEDALESSELDKKYNAKLVGEETITLTHPEGRKTVKTKYDCYVIELVAKVKEVTYYKRKIWVDKGTFVPVKEELFAKSGKKLKLMTLSNIKLYGKRYYPVYFTMSNLLRKDSLTEMIIDEVQFGLDLPDSIFTQRNLRK